MELLNSVLMFFGWKWLVVFALMYLAAYIGAHNPQCWLLHASQNGMQKTAAKLLDKARALRMGGRK